MYKRQEEQNGFCAGASCLDNIVTLKNFLKKECQNVEIHLVFIDLKKAYDSVPLNKLWSVLLKHGVNVVYV